MDKAYFGGCLQAITSGWINNDRFYFGFQLAYCSSSNSANGCGKDKGRIVQTADSYTTREDPMVKIERRCLVCSGKEIIPISLRDLSGLRDKTPVEIVTALDNGLNYVFGCSNQGESSYSCKHTLKDIDNQRMENFLRKFVDPWRKLTNDEKERDLNRFLELQKELVSKEQSVRGLVKSLFVG